jgi:hypothetical protein
MYRLAIEYIDLPSLRLVCTVMIWTGQEHWSEAWNNRDLRKAFIRYVHNSYLLVHSIV